MTPRTFVTVLAIAALAAPACRRAAPPPAPVRAENPALGLAVAAVPEPFTIASVEGETIELVAPGPGGEGRAVIAAGPVENTGINLVEAVKERRVWYEATPGAAYLGNRELGTPIGTAFTARGTYPIAGGEQEETRVFAIHPQANRLLTLTYTYPTGESERRVAELMALLGELEGLTSGEPEGRAP